ncbi:TRAP-type uncharacterized transport system substrate-binding protein [Rhodoblastus acidophilus]|uniref:TAXI family TRAP transporter solute-binding subunit n=1 Tax=Rhodoblastus acidophilus TaxID=1074 RepID=UPI0022257292|nr:TAXI family TRAP transporter solute-binding subunit [Rhodoblastus acidophilus]MCW2286040.1 TRAP-type uncharacterized transport system substrate-binding protein [Rhodoblastus acidophilus]MCW2334934.1 TRAP-type uncharacterized transport system substrate-binding protein [Rhodoblastus acidophilus]
MFGLFRFRPVALAAAGLLLIAGVILSALYVWSPQATLRITTGVSGTPANRFVGAFAKVLTAKHPRVRFDFVPVSSLAESAQAMENGKVDLALVRSDVSPPTNGRTIAIMRRDVLAIFLPDGSPIDDVSKLVGKTVAIPQGPTQENNSKALDAILTYFDIAPDKVKRLFLPVDAIGPAIHRKQASAALAVGPIGPGDAVAVAASIYRATKAAPDLLAIDQADAIVKRFPGFESIDVPEGAFKGKPPTPDDSTTCLAVTYRLVVPETMLNVVAGLIGRAVLNTKEKLITADPLASQIETPDADDTSPVLPIHPGFSAYLSSGDQSLLDALQQYLYVIGIPASLLGSLIALGWSRWRNRKLVDVEQQAYQLLVIADAARRADSAELERLDDELDELIRICVNHMTAGTADVAQAPITTLAIDHARRAIERRRKDLAAAPPPQSPGPAEAPAALSN